MDHPRESTRVQFWRRVMGRKCGAIVMLTGPTEERQVYIYIYIAML